MNPCALFSAKEFQMNRESKLLNEWNTGFFASTLDPIAIAASACREASESAKATIDAGFGKTLEDRRRLAIQFQPLATQRDLPIDVWALAQVVGASDAPCAVRSRAACLLASWGWDLSTFEMHPFATHILQNGRTGRDYYMAV